MSSTPSPALPEITLPDTGGRAADRVVRPATDDRDTGRAVAQGFGPGEIDADVAALDRDASLPVTSIPSPPKPLMIRPLTVMPLPVIVNPFAPAPAPAPSSSIKGVPEYPGCVVPSMVTGAVIAGSGDRTSIVCWPVPMAKAIVVAPPCAST